MIPLTSFAGKKLALFGLGASGLASASATWNIRLSPGRTSTVNAGPATFIDGFND